MNIPLKLETEDNAIDVLQKALLGLSESGVSISPKIASKIDEFQIRQQNDQSIDANDLAELAEALNLHAPSLINLANQPLIEALKLHAPVIQWILPFTTYTVNTYAIQTSPESCVLIDAGFEPDAFMQRLELLNLRPSALLITHNHRDHVGALATLTSKFPKLKVYAKDASIVSETNPIAEGMNFNVDGLSIEVFEIPGHAPDALVYHIHFQNQTYLAVGDGVYACSAGKIPCNYTQGIERLKTRILDQDPKALILPGHGPITRVNEERQRNPFLAGYYAKM